MAKAIASFFQTVTDTLTAEIKSAYPSPVSPVSAEKVDQFICSAVVQIGEAVSDALEDYDFGDALDDYDFDGVIDRALNNYDFSEDIEAAINGYDFSDDVEAAIDDHPAIESLTSKVSDLADLVTELQSGGFFRRLRWLVTGK